jgi:hypothetical protein
MSAREIIKEVSALSEADLKLVAVALGERLGREKAIEALVGETEKKPVPGRKLSHDEAMDHVFSEFAPVLARLAQ